jgi:hypothetical protein
LIFSSPVTKAAPSILAVATMRRSAGPDWSLPLTISIAIIAADRAIGFRYALSVLQLECARIQVFDRPLAGRHLKAISLI